MPFRAPFAFEATPDPVGLTSQIGAARRNRTFIFAFGQRRAIHCAMAAGCLWQDSNLHTLAYLASALAEYKAASLPLSYRGKLAVSMRFERMTYSLGGSRSIQLSYETEYRFLK